MADLRETVGQSMVSPEAGLGHPQETLAAELSDVLGKFHGIIQKNFTPGTWGGDLQLPVAQEVRQLHQRRRELEAALGIPGQQTGLGHQAVSHEAELG